MSNNNALEEMAESGDMLAQFLLAQYYEYGKEGREQDYQKAMFWYNQSAKQEHAPAMYCIGMLYEHGRGVAKNLYHVRSMCVVFAPSGVLTGSAGD